MYLVISYVLALALLFSLPRHTYAMSQDSLSSGTLLGALPQVNSEQLNRVLGSLLNPQPSVNQRVFTPIIEYSELDLSLLSEITVEMLRSYALQYPKLKKLKISGLIQSKRLIKVEQLKALVRYFPYLEELDISYSDLTAEDLGVLGDLKHLKHLCLNSIRITDAGIEALVKAGIAVQLTHLEVNSTNLRDSAVIDMIINHFERLTHLSIAGNYMYPSAISRLESHTYVYLDAKGNLDDPQETLKYLEAYNELRKKNKS